VIEQNPKISIQRIKLNPQLLISNSAVSFTCIVFCLLQDKSILVDKLCDVMCYTFVILFFQDELFGLYRLNQQRFPTFGFIYSCIYTDFRFIQGLVYCITKFTLISIL
jgi:hypothetical protein